MNYRKLPVEAQIEFLIGKISNGWTFCSNYGPFLKTYRKDSAPESIMNIEIRSDCTIKAYVGLDRRDVDRELHNENGPAVLAFEYDTLKKFIYLKRAVYYIDDSLHRINKPARIIYNSDKQIVSRTWSLYGKEILYEESTPGLSTRIFRTINYSIVKWLEENNMDVRNMSDEDLLMYQLRWVDGN